MVRASRQALTPRNYACLNCAMRLSSKSRLHQGLLTRSVTLAMLHTRKNRIFLDQILRTSSSHKTNHGYQCTQESSLLNFRSNHWQELQAFSYSSRSVTELLPVFDWIKSSNYRTSLWFAHIHWTQRLLSAWKPLLLLAYSSQLLLMGDLVATVYSSPVSDSSRSAASFVKSPRSVKKASNCGFLQLYNLVTKWASTPLLYVCSSMVSHNCILSWVARPIQESNTLFLEMSFANLAEPSFCGNRKTCTGQILGVLPRGQCGN